MQTGRGLCARGDQRGRGTRIEYDRKGKYSFSIETQFCPERHILFQEDGFTDALSISRNDAYANVSLFYRSHPLY